MTTAATESVHCFRPKKTAVAVTHCKWEVFDQDQRSANRAHPVRDSPVQGVRVDPAPNTPPLRRSYMCICVRGEGHNSQIYAFPQSIAKALEAFNQKCIDEQLKKEIKDIIVRYNQTDSVKWVEQGGHKGDKCSCVQWEKQT